jgi:lipopolysaccharide export system protein LptA
MSLIRKNVAFFLVFLLFTGKVFAQEQIRQIEILHANTLRGESKGGLEYRTLVGNVKIKHENVIMYCDSANDFSSERFFDAYGNIRIIQGENITLTGQILHYNLSSKVAEIEKNVTLRDGKFTLSTDKLFYNAGEKTAFYNNKAIIKDSSNTLISEKGYYYAQNKNIFFKENVELFNPDYKLQCDTLNYNLNTKTAHFLSPTHIQGKESQMYCESGWYNTSSQLSKFADHAWVQSQNHYLSGDILYYDHATGNGRALGNVVYKDSAENLEIMGNYGEHHKAIEKTYITDSALAIKYMKNDTFYIHADTLMAMKDSSGEHSILKAWYATKALSTQMALSCDSLVYKNADSIIDLYRNPLIWNGNNQITADHVSIYLKNKTIDKIDLTDNAFMISEVDSLFYDQIKGRTMTGYFDSTELKNILVSGNAESLYFLLDGNRKYIGMDRITSSYIDITLKNSKISHINFINEPGGKIYPPREMRGQNSKLKGFVWYGHLKPLSIADLYNK